MRPLPALLAGLALGSASTWIVRHELPSTPPPAAPSASASDLIATRHSLPATSLVLPPRLPTDDAEAALAAWLALGDPASADFATQARRLRALLTVLPDTLFPRLLDALATRPGEDSRRLFQTAFDIWNERDSAAAARGAVALRLSETLDARTRTRLARQAAKAWGRQDFPSAYAWALALSDPDLANAVTGALLTQLAATDPSRALTLAKTQGGDFLKTIQSNLLRTWAETDPAAAIRTLGLAVLDADKNDWSLAQALGGWIGRDAPGAVTWILAHAPSTGDHWDSLMARTLRQSGDQPAALPGIAAALMARTDSPDLFSHLSSLLGTWMRGDPNGALNWLKSLPDAAQRSDLLERNIPDNYPGLRDPDQYLPLALELPPGDTRDKKIAGLLASWAATDPDAALAWLHAQKASSPTTAADGVQGAIIAALAAKDPAAAVTAWRQLPADENRSAAIPSLARNWAKTDPAGAARWVFGQLPEKPDYPDTAEEVAAIAALSPAELRTRQDTADAYERLNGVFSESAASWFTKDPAGALAWAEALPDPKQRETALVTFSAGSPPFDADAPDPTLRATTLARISDPALREQALVNHIGRWMRSDERSARDWMESNEALSAEAVAKLLSGSSPQTN